MENAKKAQMKIDYRTTATVASAAAANEVSECAKLGEKIGIGEKIKLTWRSRVDPFHRWLSPNRMDIRYCVSSIQQVVTTTPFSLCDWKF